MKSIADIGLKDVTAVYSGAEGDLWELLMGHQIHIGGFKSSMDLAERAGIGAGLHGVDLCCCEGISPSPRDELQPCHRAASGGVGYAAAARSRAATRFKSEWMRGQGSGGGPGRFPVSLPPPTHSGRSRKHAVQPRAPRR